MAAPVSPSTGNLTNGEVLEIYRSKTTAGDSYREVHDILKKKLPALEACPLSSVVTSLNNLVEKRRALKKTKKNHDKLQTFLESPYKSPTKKMKRDNITETVQIDRESDEVLRDVNSKLARELKEKSEKLDSLYQNNLELIADNRKLKKKVSFANIKRVLNQKLKRRQDRISELKTELRELEKRLHQVESKASCSNDANDIDEQATDLMEKLKKKRRQLANSTYYWKRKGTGKQKLPSKQMKNSCNPTTQLLSKLRYYENVNTQLLDQIEILESQLICGKEDGKTYSDNLREVIYMCISKNVSLENIEHVVTFILDKLANKSLLSFPKISTVRQIEREMGVIARLEISESLKNVKDTTIKYDGTSKAKEHWAEAQLATESKTYTIGLTKTARGTAESYSNMICESISNIEATGETYTGTSSGNDRREILQNITNAMTDRCIVNQKINTQLSEKKKELDTEATPINSFYCAVHPLDSFAKGVDKVIGAWESEKGIVSQSYLHRGNSGTQSMINAVSKVFHKEGAGVPAEVRAFLESKNIKNCVLYFVGERFNLLFHNGGAVYYVSECVLEFLGKVWGKTNKLLIAVDSDLKKKELIVACRALGLIGKQITGPWYDYCMVEHPVLDVSKFYTRAVENVRIWSTDSSELLLGNGRLFDDNIQIKKDDVWVKLVEPTVDDNEVKILLQRMCGSILDVCERQLKDQLPGGRWYDPSSDIQNQAASCVCNNISGERVFAKLDSGLKRAPNASAHFLESKLMFQANETATWLEGKSQNKDEKQLIMAAARRQGRKDSVTAKMIKQKILKEKLDILRQKRQAVTTREENKRNTKENLLEDMFNNGGLWETSESMEVQLSKFRSDRKKIIAVKNQLKVRKIVLCQATQDSKLFAFSQGAKQFSLAKLKENIVALMAKPVDEECIKIAELLNEPNNLVGKYLSHRWVDGEKENWYEGRCVTFVSENDEFGIEYFSKEEESVTYLTIAEVVADMRNGDFVVVW